MSSFSSYKNRFKVFVYEDVPEALNADLRTKRSDKCKDNGYANAEWKIPELIAKSEVYTPDPDLADFYVVPLFPECYVRDKLEKGGADYVTAVRKVNKMYQAAIDRIAGNYPYWRRSEGRDHVFIFPAEKGAENVLNEKTLERIGKAIKIVGVPTFKSSLSSSGGEDSDGDGSNRGDSNSESLEEEEKEGEENGEGALGGAGGHGHPSAMVDDDLLRQQMASMRGILSKSKRLNVHSLGNYTFGVKVVKKKEGGEGGEEEKSNAKDARLRRIREQYGKSGGIARRSVAGVCVVNQHGCPHVLLLQESTLPPGAQQRTADGKPASQWDRPGQHFSANTSTFRLPGGRLRAGEGTTEGLKRKLANKLAAPNESNEANLRASFDILDQLSTWYRIGFEPQMYPYLPPHVTKPKETLEVFLVELPEKCYFAVPKTSKLVAVPIFELYDNAEKFGAVASSIPHLLSRIDINLETTIG
jgi:cleavage and polyadenylation specificity factor subunit 5